LIRSILISALLHGFFIILLVSTTPHESDGSADNRIRIRIDNNLSPKDVAEPSTVKNKTPPRDLSDIPREITANVVQEDSIGDESIDELAATFLEPLVPPRSKPNEQIQGIEEPLVDFDYQSNAKTSFRGSWLINWVGGREREILSFPVVDAAQFPEESEKLLDVVIKIRVSPQGEVLSAELVPPGSGDTRVDRYMHGVALQLILEPWFGNEKIQEAHLRLLFLEDSL